MMTNTYKPILGGLEKSVEGFSNEYRKRGHQVIIVAPEFKDAKVNLSLAVDGKAPSAIHLEI